MIQADDEPFKTLYNDRKSMNARLSFVLSVCLSKAANGGGGEEGMISPLDC